MDQSGESTIGLSEKTFRTVLRSKMGPVDTNTSLASAPSLQAFGLEKGNGAQTRAEGHGRDMTGNTRAPEGPPGDGGHGPRRNGSA